MIACDITVKSKGGREDPPHHQCQRRLACPVRSRGGRVQWRRAHAVVGKDDDRVGTSDREHRSRNERQRLHALLHHDIDTAQRLHAIDFELIDPLGEVLSRENVIDSGLAFAYTEFKPITPIRVRVHGDSAVIRYESEIELHGTRGHYWHTDLYEKRNGQWKIVWSQTTGAR